MNKSYFVGGPFCIKYGINMVSNPATIMYSTLFFLGYQVIINVLQNINYFAYVYLEGLRNRNLSEINILALREMSLQTYENLFYLGAEFHLNTSSRSNIYSLYKAFEGNRIKLKISGTIFPSSFSRHFVNNNHTLFQFWLAILTSFVTTFAAYTLYRIHNSVLKCMIVGVIQLVQKKIISQRKKQEIIKEGSHDQLIKNHRLTMCIGKSIISNENSIIFMHYTKLYKNQKNKLYYFMIPNFEHSLHLKENTQNFPQSEQCQSHHNFSLNNDNMRTYSVDNLKLDFDRWNTQTQTEAAKQEPNPANPLIQNQNLSAKLMLIISYKLIRIVQISFELQVNEPELIDFNKVIKFNSEETQKEDQQLQLQYERNYESHNSDLIVVPTPSQRNKLKAVGNMFLGIWRLQQNVVEPIKSTEQFYDNFGSTQRHFNSNYKQIHPAKDSEDLRLMDIFNQFKLVCLFTQHSMSGSSEDIQHMIKILQRDPKRNLTNPQDPNHIINQLNQYGQNALYIASKNGNVEVIKFLLSLECNPHIRSRIVEDLTESPLEVSSRWHHLECVRLLLNAGKYTNAELRSAIKVTENQEIINLLKLNMTSSLFSCCL
ncbi:unnamed protein product (macronuclear) [Paramecium tetraurelia]|uniref:Uncharacterized protein n=1 Tax=Paramecium tetraurelia TaxID=5888 RepID=A0CEP9_PARTE|nr:uncharacterized protein GSPATT00037705001 [Paramecium tetraurelia]CAK69266.1 unnamed protein product [Paramecium tetraurelia]|eukprot:XP_001436663.1 hypothetical protein (macronuclear) [Paramecium tetraurelia strain d4-2]